jgi:hypothetical protein
MSSLYPKIAVASVCTALSFILGTNQEAKAATFNFTLISAGFAVESYFTTPDENGEGTEIRQFITGNDSELPMYKEAGSSYESRVFYEFPIGNLSLAPNIDIKSAFFETATINVSGGSKYFFVESFAYVGNGIPDLSDFEVGKNLFGYDFNFFEDYPYYSIKVDVKDFVTQRVRNGDAFAGFGFRPATSFTLYSTGTASMNNLARLTIEAEIVPEPTTIFGSALALGVGGWLKRKKLNHQSKTKSQP